MTVRLKDVFIYNTYLTLFLVLPIGLTIGFNETVYTVNETNPGYVEVCALATVGTLEGSVSVEFMTVDGSAQGM